MFAALMRLKAKSFRAIPAARIMGQLTTRRSVMPFLPIVFGLGELEAATAIGISASKFRTLVSERRMPSPRRWYLAKVSIGAGGGVCDGA
jgi:hypothetical protein